MKPMRHLLLAACLATPLALGKGKNEPAPPPPKHGGSLSGLELYDANVNSSISWGVMDPVDAKPLKPEDPSVTTIGRIAPPKATDSYTDKGRPLLKEIEEAKKKSDEVSLSEPYKTGVRVGDKDGLALSQYDGDKLEKLTVNGQTIIRPTKLNGQALTKSDLNYVATNPGTQIPLINGPPIGSPSSPQEG